MNNPLENFSNQERTRKAKNIPGESNMGRPKKSVARSKKLLTITKESAHRLDDLQLKIRDEFDVKLNSSEVSEIAWYLMQQTLEDIKRNKGKLKKAVEHIQFYDENNS